MVNLTRGSALLAFEDLVSSLGGDAEALMRAHGVDPEAAGDYERFISYTAAASVIGAAARELDCPDFGMRLARSQDIKILGPVAVIIRHSETVADAIEGVSRYLHNCAPADTAGLRRGPRAAVYTFTITLRQLPHRDQVVERGLGIAVGAFRLMAGDDFVPLKVTMQHRRISPAETYRDMFGCPLEFGSDLNSVHLPNHVLTRPIRGRDAAALTLAENYLALVRRDHSFADHVHELIQRLLAVNRASLPVVAREMAMHPRAVQRRLAQSDTSFEEILDDVRRTMAWRLAATGVQASQIATMLGYSEQSSYSRACQRWYGESPSQLAARRRNTRANV
ncbi:AraC family transcriptional regulator [Streptomyces sp. NPDC101234]|uniref:AraC family transcriptional regulator n=1 Tax=Streptomyces sp. NPDC101234 TaxID=3366138 RepID=UPI0038090A9F